MEEQIKAKLEKYLKYKQELIAQVAAANGAIQALQEILEGDKEEADGENA